MCNKSGKSNSIYLNKYLISIPNHEYILKGDFSVFLINENEGINNQIVDSKGNICNFPGVERTEKLNTEYGNGEITPTVKYEVIFEKIDDDKFIMVWTIRPDGFYWMDSWGFGAEDYESVSLYSYIDAKGNFMAPFKLYEIGNDFYGEYKLKRNTI